MILRPPSSTCSVTLCPFPTLFLALYRPGKAVASKEGGAKMASALAAFAKLFDRFGGELGEDFGRMRATAERFGEAAFGGDRRQCHTRVERAGRIAQYPTQCHRGVGAEARGEVRHRAARQIADRLQSGADERGSRLGLQFERGDGQAADRLAFVGGRACLIACKRTRRVGGRLEESRVREEGVSQCAIWWGPVP